jgi:hypothetical protein
LIRGRISIRRVWAAWLDSRPDLDEARVGVSLAAVSLMALIVVGAAFAALTFSSVGSLQPEELAGERPRVGAELRERGKKV